MIKRPIKERVLEGRQYASLCSREKSPKVVAYSFQMGYGFATLDIVIGHIMSNTAALKTLVENWLMDVQRRGAELYAENEAEDVLYFSFEGKDQLRFSLRMDFDLQELTVQINSPELPGTTREVLLLNQENLRVLAKRMCSVPEGKAMIPVYLLARLAILCHAYQRLLAEYDREHHIHTSTNTVQEIEAELRQCLTPEEQQRTENPFLRPKAE
jgi:hypothetical protein